MNSLDSLAKMIKKPVVKPRKKTNPFESAQKRYKDKDVAIWNGSDLVCWFNDCYNEVFVKKGRCPGIEIPKDYAIASWLIGEHGSVGAAKLVLASFMFGYVGLQEQVPENIGWIRQKEYRDDVLARFDILLKYAKQEHRRLWKRIGEG